MLQMLLGRGTAGLPAAAPVDFPTLRLPSSPNAHLAAPPGATNERHETVPLLPVPAESAWGVLRGLGDGMERVWKMAEWPELRQAQWVARTRLMNYPDLINAQIVELPGGTGLFLYSRSLIGYSDLGVNAKRIADWRAAFDRALSNAR
ncbi:DUF1499 domain-containing protein [Falsiroseomonas oryziterrae]|uniref:DUF1499 domain-containing protein n=1 Tax=Falsiroseomonas oryziterrae TaxID=2911368 RepID=UPI001F1AD816|nr:DUF1499 domain-containing protein [Roseomonas sp. NPKOSM-4]